MISWVDWWYLVIVMMVRHMDYRATQLLVRYALWMPPTNNTVIALKTCRVSCHRSSESGELHRTHESHAQTSKSHVLAEHLKVQATVRDCLQVTNLCQSVLFLLTSRIQWNNQTNPFKLLLNVKRISERDVTLAHVFGGKSGHHHNNQ